ncbi:MAG: DUF4434 domain-containing protein [Lentisphaerae bacterium]|nr:DUF4434 domain-containing protein [Lentisphaerota bacterium]
MRITGTFIDEISHDIPHQNWGEKEWEQDFIAMKAIGIDTVIMIRCYCQRFMTYPSEYLIKHCGGFRPPVDLVELYLTLADKYDMDFYFGLYDGGCMFYPWYEGALLKDIDPTKAVIDEVYERYSHHKSFKGWYLNREMSLGGGPQVVDEMLKFNTVISQYAKNVSNGMPTMMSPYFSGVKAGWQKPSTMEDHYKIWQDLFGELSGSVDIVAFQDGHCDYHELEDYIAMNTELASRFNVKVWTNCESFDRDMPINFLPIKWEKMLLKLEAARKAGVDKAITFEFSHFMSPNSCYRAAGHLYNRYREYFNI